jgi:hypothetical protein
MFTFTDFLSNVGGFMGLLAGVSIISIIEVVYHIVSCRQSHRKIQQINLNLPIRIAWRNENHALYQLSKYFVEYIKTSDIHGVHYLTDQRLTRGGKILWTLLIASSISICSFIVVYIYKHAEKSPVAISIDPQVLTLDEVRKVLITPVFVSA